MDIADPVLDLVRGKHKHSRRPAVPLGHRLATVRADCWLTPFLRGLCDRGTGFYSRDGRLAPLGVSLALGR